jgi:hypothetical protein
MRAIADIRTPNDQPGTAASPQYSWQVRFSMNIEALGAAPSRLSLG